MATLTKQKEEPVFWIADCYDLAKRFPNPQTWRALLEPLKQGRRDLSPFQVWLWMEIWKAAQDRDEHCA